MSSRKDEYLLWNQLVLQAPCLCSVSRGREHDRNCLIPWKCLVVISVPLKLVDSIIYSLAPGAQLSLPRVAKMHLQHFSSSGMCCSAQSSLFLKQLPGLSGGVDVLPQRLCYFWYWFLCWKTRDWWQMFVCSGGICPVWQTERTLLSPKI